jgi:hypothetical protein
MSLAALRAKFNALAGVAITPARADALAQQVLHLDELDDAMALLPLLVGDAEPHALIV